MADRKSHETELLGFGYVREAYDQDDVPSDVILLIIEFTKLFIDSTILSPEEQRWLANLIEKQPQTAKFKNCEWKLLCRGARDGKGDYNAFHRLCDDKKNTICLLDMNTGFVSGGFASSAWKSTHRNTACKDDDAFLFTVRPTDKRNIFHRKRGKYGKLVKPNGGLLHNKGDAYVIIIRILFFFQINVFHPCRFNFGYNDFFWGNYHEIPCKWVCGSLNHSNYFDVESNEEVCGKDSRNGRVEFKEE